MTYDTFQIEGFVLYAGACVIPFHAFAIRLKLETKLSRFNHRTHLSHVALTHHAVTDIVVKHHDQITELPATMVPGTWYQRCYYYH